ncbi:hypothetical protein [Limnobacter sp. MED105]|uniref:hypothetical protein n=1 Tax=Limnobacter sp. MED105 TaxID=391597 RepID=UPI000156C74D|nr:hypothetical protein [Limnobacter sp. MED105]EDM83179.1 hypothetical protein LMED105_09710 [Limnobacter sp. MED105]
MTTFESKDQNTTAAAPAPQEQETIKGQSAFHVELSPVGIVVRTVFVGENSELRAAPAAVFQNLDMAIHQLDELKRLVLGHFGQAALIGMQALQQAEQQAQQAAPQSASESASESAPNPSNDAKPETK